MIQKIFDMYRIEIRLIWVTLAFWLVLLEGQAFLDKFGFGYWESRSMLPDFFQEWSSARCYLDDLPLYPPMTVPVERYLHFRLDPNRTTITVNAHPPSSILLALPFAYLDLSHAFLAWNLVNLLPLAASLWIVKRQMSLTVSAWTIFPLTALLILCSPLWEQIRLGQLSLALLLLLTGTWASARSGRPRLAGFLVGTAVAIKLFPALLFPYYAARRRWDIVFAGLATLLALSGFTAAAFGVRAYLDYVQVAIPDFQWFRVGWNNASLNAYWSRLFDPVPERVRHYSRSSPLWYDPAFARWAYWLSSAAVIAAVVWAARRVRNRDDEDRAFGVAVTATLLISPITWEHYFLLLLAPLAVYWSYPRWSRAESVTLALVTSFLFLSPVFVWTFLGYGGKVARPIDNLTMISYQFYALLGLFALGVRSFRNSAGSVS